MNSVKFVRLFVDEAGESHMEDEDLAIKSSAFAPPAPPLGVSSMEPAAGWRLLQLPAGWVGDWHPSPERMWIFCLHGDMEFQASDSAVLQVKPGSALLLEDTAGKGHRSRVMGDRDALLVAVKL